MRLLISLLLLGVIACAEQPKGFAFKLRGDFINVDTATVNVLSPEGEVLLSIRMEEGKFVLQGTLSEPGYYAIDMGNQRKVRVMLDAPDMYWPSDYNMVDARYVKNSPGTKSMLDILGVVRETYEIPTRALYDEYYEKVGSRNLSPEQEAELEKLAGQKFVERGETILAYVEEHANDLYMPVFIEDQLSEYDYDWGKRGYDLLSPEMQASQPGRLLKAKLDNLSHTVVGAMFPTFAVQDAKGNMVDLKFGNGKVYVIDFWASWCGPCRAMMKQLKELYKAYAGKSVDFISISLDSTEEAWLSAHEEEQIPWGSYWIKENFNSTIAERLGIEAIPFIVVVDQEGKIAGKNLRDQKLIDKVNELLK